MRAACGTVLCVVCHGPCCRTGARRGVAWRGAACEPLAQVASVPSPIRRVSARARTVVRRPRTGIRLLIARQRVICPAASGAAGCTFLFITFPHGSSPARRRRGPGPSRPCTARPLGITSHTCRSSLSDLSYDLRLNLIPKNPDVTCK